MVEVGIAVPDRASAQTLVQRLLSVFDEASVSVDKGGTEVLVQAERTTTQAVVQVLRTVSDWLDEGGVPTAQVRLEARSYTLVGDAAYPAGPAALA